VSHGYFAGMLAGTPQDRMHPNNRMRRKERSPCLEIGPSLCLPPVEPWRGTSPTEAAKARSDAFRSVTMVVHALVPKMPMPAIGASRLLGTLERCSAMIRVSIDPAASFLLGPT
jgi:hypothetical protein